MIFPSFLSSPLRSSFSSVYLFVCSFLFFSFKFLYLRLPFIYNQLTSFISLSHNVPQHDEEINDKKDGRGRCERIDIIHWEIPSFQEDVWQVFHVIRPYEINQKEKKNKSYNDIYQNGVPSFSTLM